jgi:hypothetical protein
MFTFRDDPTVAEAIRDSYAPGRVTAVVRHGTGAALVHEAIGRAR